MEMRIVVASTEGATTLGERLRAAFGSARVRVHGESREVDIRLDEESNRSVLRVLEAVERWLDQAGAGFAEMQLGERSYTLARGAPFEGPR